CRDFYLIPAALPQAKIEAAPSALRVVTDRPERHSYSNFSFGAVSGDHGLVLSSDTTISAAYARKSWHNAATCSPQWTGPNLDRFFSASPNKRTAGCK